MLAKNTWPTVFHLQIASNYCHLTKNDAAYCLREKAVDYVRKFPAEVVATGEWKKANEEKAEWFLNIKDMLFDLFVPQSKGTK